MNTSNFIMDLRSLLTASNIRAVVFNYGDSFCFTLPNNVELTTLIIVKFAELAKKHKCTSSYSYYDNKLTFIFRF